jgi:hypothetical protein
MTAAPADPPASPPRMRRHHHATTARRPSPLARAVVTTVEGLDGLTGALDHVTRTALDRRLRAALGQHVRRAGEGAPGVAAVRVACAHLAAGDVELSYLALLTARDQLG